MRHCLTTMTMMTSGSEPFKVNGWRLIAHPLFLTQAEIIKAAVARDQVRTPDRWRSRRPAKLWGAIVRLAFRDIPADPSHERFRQGNTMGPSDRHWRRAKFYQQYRLFFRFHAGAKIIVLAWVNDDGTKRAYGKATDAYTVFRGMLESGTPPDDWDALVRACDAEGGDRLQALTLSPASIMDGQS